MTSPTTGAWRAVRAVLVVALVVGLSTGGHLLAGGQVASWRAAVLALLLVSAGVAGITATRLTPVRLVAALGAGQVVVHHALSWTPGGHCATAGSSALFASTTIAGCRPAGGHEALWTDPGMLLAHLVATVVAAAVLGRGEQLLWTVRALLRPDRSSCPTSCRRRPSVPSWSRRGCRARAGSCSAGPTPCAAHR
ncbi:hypothetical protein [Aquipuribacter sp. MA13-6]|uniref:hypothetical protein n=1 Tax=unclassified Aquipuribacter TaxID=2635084 RepID=UPI003EEC6252